MKSQKNRIAFFSECGYDIVSAPLINSAIYLSGIDYYVDIFVEKSDRFKIPKFENERISIHPYKKFGFYFKFPFSIVIYKILFLIKRIDRKYYKYFIGFDQVGLKIAGIMGLLKKVPVVYHNLEIIPSVDRDKNSRELKRIEKIFSKYCKLIIMQDILRVKYVSEKNKIKTDKFCIVYNSDIGSSVSDKKNYFREKFSISNDKKIVLNIGSMISEHMAYEISRSAESWDPDYVLVNHGWFSDQRLEDQILELVEKNPSKIFISTEIFEFHDKIQLIQSVDIGLVMYKPVNENMQFVGGSSGKLFDFMRCGVPMIALKGVGLEPYILKSQSGLVIDDLSQINEAFKTIISNYKLYSEAAIKSYPDYEFSKKYKEVAVRLGLL